MRVQLDPDTSVTAKKIVFKDIMWHNAAPGTHSVRQCQTPPSKVELYFSLQSTLVWMGRCVACPVRLWLIPRSGQSTEESSHIKTVPSSLSESECSFHRGKIWLSRLGKCPGSLCRAQRAKGILVQTSKLQT